MNIKQQHVAQSQDKYEAVIQLRGKSYTIAEAISLAAKEYSFKNLQNALDIYNLIIAKVPDYVVANNKRSDIIQEMKSYNDALERCDKAIALNPALADGYSNRGVILQEMKRYEEALASYDKAIALKPDYDRAYNNRGTILQILKRYKYALASFDRAIELKPDYANAYYNRGVVLQALKRFDDALASYDKAIAIEPAYSEAYNNRGNTLQLLKRFDDALASYDKAILLKVDYAECYSNRGVVLQLMKRNDEALESYDKAIALKFDYAENYSNRGVILQEMKRYDDALASYDKAILLKVDYAEAYNNRGNTLRKLKRHEDALASYDKAISLKPDYAEAYHNRGNTLQVLTRFNDALASYDKAIALKPDYAKAYNNRGSSLVSKGNMREAEKNFLRAIALKPDYTHPIFGLTNIRKYSDADHADIKNIKDLLNMQGNALRGREYLCFALGKIYDDCGRYDDAFEYYRQANQILNSEVSYNPSRVVEVTDNIIEVFSRDVLDQSFEFSSGNQSPLFIVGMPRSGTTLMASILSNHGSIGTAGELSNMAAYISHLPKLVENDISYPQAVQYINTDIASSMISDYEKRLRRDISFDIPFVIDKYPLNFKNLWLIAMLFPKARIIHCTRHPLDTCLSNYFQYFAMEYDYSFDLNNVGHFYNEYTKLMEHWRKVLPINMIEVSYEDMIMDTEQTARRVLDFIGLEWDERCLSPHTNPYAVETSSKWQVRQPIYKQSVERWRNYEKHLQPLKEILGISGT